MTRAIIGAFCLKAPNIVMAVGVIPRLKTTGTITED
jgi:hypothetical protein